MASVAKDEVSLLAGGESYTLCFSINSIIEVEAAAGTDINAVLERLQGERPDFGVVRLLLWGMLIDNHPEISQQEAGRIMPAGGFPELSEKLQLAIARAMPAEAAGKKNPRRASPNGAGRTR